MQILRIDGWRFITKSNCKFTEMTLKHRPFWFWTPKTCFFPGASFASKSQTPGFRQEQSKDGKVEESKREESKESTAPEEAPTFGRTAFQGGKSVVCEGFWDLEQLLKAKPGGFLHENFRLLAALRWSKMVIPKILPKMMETQRMLMPRHFSWKTCTTSPHLGRGSSCWWILMWWESKTIFQVECWHVCVQSWQNFGLSVTKHPVDSAEIYKWAGDLFGNCWLSQPQ